jgi:hypothetical protein
MRRRWKEGDEGKRGTSVKLSENSGAMMRTRFREATRPRKSGIKVGGSSSTEERPSGGQG